MGQRVIRDRQAAAPVRPRVSKPAGREPATSVAAGLLRLQRTVGNQAVIQVIEGGLAVQRRPDLHRAGKKNDPTIDKVRESDVTHYDKDGDTWVQGPLKGGVSTFAVKNPKLKGFWWTYGAASPDPANLLIRNDKGTHWSWEPAADMPLTTYLAALRATVPSWTRD